MTSESEIKSVSLHLFTSHVSKFCLFTSQKKVSILLSLVLYSMGWLMCIAWAANEHVTVSVCVQGAVQTPHVC